MLLNRMLRRRREKGITLIEVAMALALVAIVTAAIMYSFQSASISQRTETAMKDLAALQNAVRTLYGNQPNFSGINTADMVAARVIPNRLVQNANTGELRTAFNGGLEIAPDDAGGGAASGFSISFADVPSEACVRLAVLDLGSGLVRLTVGGTPPYNENSPNWPPLTSEAIGACGSATEVDMTWVFR